MRQCLAKQHTAREWLSIYWGAPSSLRGCAPVHTYTQDGGLCPHLAVAPPHPWPHLEVSCLHPNSCSCCSKPLPTPDSRPAALTKIFATCAPTPAAAAAVSPCPSLPVPFAPLACPPSSALIPPSPAPSPPPLSPTSLPPPPSPPGRLLPAPQLLQLLLQAPAAT